NRGDLGSRSSCVAALGNREIEVNGGALSARTFDPDPAAMRVDDSLGDVESETAAAAIAVLLLPVSIESMGQMRLGNSRAAVHHGELDLPGELLRRNEDRGAPRAELDGIADEIRKHAQDEILFTKHVQKRGW